MTFRHTELLKGAVILTALGFLWAQLSEVPAGARMFPQMVMLTMGLLTCVMMLRSAAGRTAPNEAAEEWHFFKHAGRFFATVGLFVLYVAGVGSIGYFTSSVVFLLALPLAFGFRQPVVLSVTMGAFLVFVWGIFVLVFDRLLPPAALGAVLGG